MSYMSKNYWLHRVSWNAELAHPLLDKGILTVGFSDFALEDNIIGKIQRDGDSTVTLDFLSQKYWKGKSRARYSLKYFVNMKKGDYVVVPLSGVFSVYEIVDDGAKSIKDLGLTDIKDWSGNLVSRNQNGLLINSKNEVFDIGFFREVKPVMLDISRSDYADESLNRFLKVRQTTLPMRADLGESVEAAIKNASAGKKIAFYPQAIDKVKELLGEALDEINTDDKLEKLVLEYFKCLGADAYIPPKNNPEIENYADSDVVATFEDLKTIYYVQVKKHYKDSETSDWSVQQIDEYRRQKTDESQIDDGYSKIAWVISTANDFTKEAKNHATESNIRLTNRAEFSTMLLNAGLGNFRTI